MKKVLKVNNNNVGFYKEVTIEELDKDPGFIIRADGIKIKDSDFIVEDFNEAALDKDTKDLYPVSHVKKSDLKNNNGYKYIYETKNDLSKLDIHNKEMFETYKHNVVGDLICLACSDDLVRLENGEQVDQYSKYEVVYKNNNKYYLVTVVVNLECDDVTEEDGNVERDILLFIKGAYNSKEKEFWEKFLNLSLTDTQVETLVKDWGAITKCGITGYDKAASKYSNYKELILESTGIKDNSLKKCDAF